MSGIIFVLIIGIAIAALKTKQRRKVKEKWFIEEIDKNWKEAKEKQGW